MQEMNFDVKTKKDKYVVATTDKGHTLQYAIVPAKDLVFHKSELSDLADATVIEIDCSFEVNGKMCDRLNQSKKIFVTGFCTDKTTSKIFFEALPLFDFYQLNDILHDMCVAFGLQSYNEQTKD